MNNAPIVGKLADENSRRDAIHVAVDPVVAGEELPPGAPIRLVPSRFVAFRAPPEVAVGIVDPFLAHNVLPGERFWLFLLPGTVTGLRHTWSYPHPAPSEVK